MFNILTQEDPEGKSLMDGPVSFLVPEEGPTFMVLEGKAQGQGIKVPWAKGLGQLHWSSWKAGLLSWGAQWTEHSVKVYFLEL